MIGEAWADILLADDSGPMLLAWADWLEEEGDEACRGVREFLVKSKRRPEWNTAPGSIGDCYCWGHSKKRYTIQRIPHALRPRIYARLSLHDQQTSNFVWYDANSSRAEAYYRALYDAARAFTIAYPKAPRHSFLAPDP